MIDYLSHSGFITFMVIATLSFYFIATIYLFVYRFRIIKQRLNIEQTALSQLYKNPNSEINKHSIFYSYINRNSNAQLEMVLKSAKNDTVRILTKGLTYLAIMATTAPFVGLFGTVVGILNAFSKLALIKGGATLNIVAPAISEALIATAVGIFVAIFAYSANLYLKRKVYELNSIMESISDILISRGK